MAIANTTAGRWFSRVVWLGITANLALALPSIAAPDQLVAMSGLPTVTPHLWVLFAGLLLILLSAFYAPAAIDPDRYRANAWLAVVSRLAGVVFFSGEPTYRLLGAFDLVFLVPEAVLLFMATRNEPSTAAGMAGKSITGVPAS
jgi:hypothetical protein